MLGICRYIRRLTNYIYILGAPLKTTPFHFPPSCRRLFPQMDPHLWRHQVRCPLRLIDCSFLGELRSLCKNLTWSSFFAYILYVPFSVDNVTTTPATNETNACSELEAGDVVVTLMNSDNPDQLAFFALTTVSPEVDTIFVTDQAWNGTSFMGNEEGTMAVSKAWNCRPSGELQSSWYY